MTDHIKLTADEWQVIVTALDAHAGGLVGILADGPWGAETGRIIQGESDLAERLRSLFDPHDGTKPEIIVTVRRRGHSHSPFPGDRASG